MTVTTLYDPNVELIDQDIAKHEISIRELKSRRNTHAQVAKLPAEMLSKIFMFCVTPNDERERLHPRNRWSWIKVSHVCHHWRMVALGCAALWCRPEFSKPAWIPEMLKRSKMAPLTIKMTDNYITPKSVEAVNAALQYMFRVKDLNLSLPREHFEKLLSAIDQPAPHLHALSLDASWANFRNEPGLTLPGDFMNGDTPRLAHLQLTDCYLPWDSSLLKNLTHLKLHHHDRGVALLPSMEQFTEVLGRMPNLETLDLKNILPSGSIPSSPHVILSQLRTIFLEGEVVGCASLLNHMSFPSTATMHFDCAIGDNEENFTSILLPLSKICSRFSVHSTLDPINLHTLCVSLSGYEITIDTGITSKSNRVPWLYLSMSWTTISDKKMVEVVNRICTLLPSLTSLRSLHLEAPRKYFDMESMKNFLSPLSQVHTLQVKGACVRDILKALMVCDDSHIRVKMLPSLRTMSLKDVDFNDKRRKNEAELVGILMDCLMTRYEYNAGMCRLRLENCLCLDTMDVELLNQIVVYVEWDGRELGFDDTEDEDSDSEYFISRAWY